MPQNLCVLDPASTGTAESSGGATETQLYINMGQRQIRMRKNYLQIQVFMEAYIYFETFFEKMSSGATTKQKVITLHPEYANVNILKHYFQ